MVRPIMKDIFFLNQKSEPATEADRQVAEDLLDTLKAHEAGCVGMAANMIGVRKNIIAVNMGFVNVVMYNPKKGMEDMVYVRLSSAAGKNVTVQAADASLYEQDITEGSEVLLVDGKLVKCTE